MVVEQLDSGSTLRRESVDLSLRYRVFIEYVSCADTVSPLRPRGRARVQLNPMVR